MAIRALDGANKRLNLSFIMLYFRNLSKFLVFFVLGEVWHYKVRTTQMVKRYDGGTGVLDELVIIEDCNDPLFEVPTAEV